MNENDIKKLLEKVAAGDVSIDGAMGHLRDLPLIDFGVAKHDSHRPLRNGFSEVIFCKGKHPDHLLKIVDEMSKREHNVFGTHADEDTLKRISETFPNADCDSVSRTFRIINRSVDPIDGRLAILCAGTADVPVSEEARRTAAYFGVEAICHYDVGVAGLHRLLKYMDGLHEIDCAIVIAGMEGALPSVVGGLISVPVIAVPTSVGYGANLSGLTTLLAMLNSCSEGISVVNIDNGFGAACAALRIIRGLTRRK